MKITRISRFVLIALSICIVGWSFGEVISRQVGQVLSRRKQPVTLTIMQWGDHAEDHVVASLVADYGKLHPDVQIIRINGGGDFDSKLRTMMAAGTPPDLFYLQPESLADFASMNLIAPIDDRFDREPASFKNDFFPLLLDGFRYNTATQHVGPGGKLYGLPKDFTTACFYVNKNLFRAAGIPIPYNGWTWDEFLADMQRIKDLSKLPEFAGRDIYGANFELWPATLRNILWTYGGDFFGPGGFRDVALDSPQSQQALQMICKARLEDKTVFNSTGIDKDGGQEFFNGNIGCDGPVGRWKMPFYKDIKSFEWDQVPVPYKTSPVSPVFYTAWTLSSKTRYPDQAYELMKFLCGRDGQIASAHLGLAVPSLKSVAYSDDYLNPPELPKNNAKLFLDAISYARLGQLPPEAEFVRIVGDHITRSIQMGQETPLQSAQTIKQLWLGELDSPLRRQAWPAMRWNLILSLCAAAGAMLAGILVWRARREKLGPIDRAQERAGWLFIAPWLIGFLLLALGPMIASLLLSFSKWSAMVPISQAESVGTANFQQILLDSSFYKSLRVTFYFVILAVPIGQAAALAVAMLMNSKVRGIEIFRTIYFVPSVVSGAALSVMWLQIFNNKFGIFNKLLAPAAHLLHTTPPDWFGVDAGRWIVPAFVIMGLWGVGSGMIIYLAGLKGISASLYEAATIDGAGPLRRFWNVTLPMLSPLLFYNLVMGIIGSFQVFTQAYIMTGGTGGPDQSAMFYVLNLYRQAFEFHNMGYASALAWILFIIILALTLLVFAGSKRMVYYEGLRS
jgi:multiple sugar transport system permease protein